MKPSDEGAGESSVLLVTPEGVIADAHETACLTIGWSREELLNRPMSDILEYGHDLVMDSLVQLQDESNEVFSVSTLVRRNDQTSFPATAIVRRVPELGCFTVEFGDLPDATATAEVATEVTTEAAPEPVRAVESDPTLADVQEPVESANAPRFRNIFLSGGQRPGAKEESVEAPVATPAASNASTPTNGKHDLASQLETERQERKRVEGRVLALNDQLQQLHAQLKNNLESETIYHKRMADSEEEIRKAQQGKVDAEVALREEQKKREKLEQDLTELKASFEQQEEERKTWQAEWLGKLQSNLAALLESDSRVEKEIATRRGIEVKLQMLQQDFGGSGDSKRNVAAKNGARANVKEAVAA
jgi:hypothetical protein